MRFLALYIAIILVQLPATAAENLPTREKSNLTILADERLLMPLADLVRQYAVIEQTPLTVVVKNAATAENQIEQGLEAHVLLTANRPMIDRLSEQGLTDVTSRRTIARTQIALVTASALSKQALFAKRVSFAAMIIATPNLPIIAIESGANDSENITPLLKGFEFSDSLNQRLQLKSDRDEVVETLLDSDALGLMIATDAVAEPDLAILSLLPDDVSKPVIFSAVVLGSESMTEAKDFVTYLSSRQAQRIFAHYGFQSPTN